MTLEIADPCFPSGGVRNWLPDAPLADQIHTDCAHLASYRCRLVSCALWHHTPPWQPQARELIDEGIYLTLHGGMRIRAHNGKQYRVPPNHIALIPRWLRHQHGYLQRGQSSQQMLAIHCHWTDHAGRSLFARLPQLSFPLPTPLWRQRLLSIAYHFSESPQNAKALAPALLQTLLHDLILSGVRLLPEDHPDAAISAALSRCQHEDWPQLSVTDLAQVAHLQPSRFRERFRHVTGMSPVRYLQGMRLEHAARLLQNTDTKLSGIAQSVGFSSVTHFHAAFKQRFGCTPQTWRQMDIG